MGGGTVRGSERKASAAERMVNAGVVESTGCGRNGIARDRGLSRSQPS